MVAINIFCNRLTGLLRNRLSGPRQFLIVSTLGGIASVAFAIGLAAKDHNRTEVSASTEKRPVSVADAVSMRMLGDRDYYYGDYEVPIAQFSPDGRKFVIVVRKGNLERNTNEYSLFLWQTIRIFESADPTLLLSMESSSNDEAISRVQWLEDNQQLAFLGEKPGESKQVYLFDTRKRVLQKLTDHGTNIISFSLTPDGSTLAFLAEEPEKNILDENEERFGYVVTTEALPALMLNKIGGKVWGESQLFVQERGKLERRLESRHGMLPPGNVTPLLSPNGRLVAITTEVPVKDIKPEWAEYSDVFMKRLVAMKRTPEMSYVLRYTLIDTHSNDSKILLESPASLDSEAFWRSDSHAIEIGGVYLPLSDTSGNERRERQSSTFSVHVTIDEANVSIIGKELRLQGVDQHDCVIARDRSASSSREERVICPAEKQEWRQSTTRSSGRPIIELIEAMNTPPTIVARDGAGHRTMLMDLNPQFSQIRFAREEMLQWLCRDGHMARGGLYYPIDYETGKEYPLVIQTHSFDPDRFWILGPWTTGYAAQPLAGKNIMVLQLDEGHTDKDTPIEVDRETSTIEGAIDFLAGKKLIDVNRVGIYGFSRSCLYVRHALTHSEHKFAAASLADGVDGSYFQYLHYINYLPAQNRFFEGVNGGVPFGAGIHSWIRRSAFSLDRVNTPVRLLTLGSVLGEWELFGALYRLGKPVEMIYMNDAEHILQKPWQRFASEQGNVDWFCFWLKGEEDPTPAKEEQYRRWRGLRGMQQRNESKAAQEEATPTLN